MNRKDISFTSETVRSETTLVMRVHVDRMSKNDEDRVGHERLVATRSADVQECMHGTQNAEVSRCDELQEKGGEGSTILLYRWPPSQAEREYATPSTATLLEADRHGRCVGIWIPLAPRRCNRRSQSRYSRTAHQGTWKLEIGCSTSVHQTRSGGMVGRKLSFGQIDLECTLRIDASTRIIHNLSVFKALPSRNYVCSACKLNACLNYRLSACMLIKLSMRTEGRRESVVIRGYA
jgi:hypothetical protein